MQIRGSFFLIGRGDVRVVGGKICGGVEPIRLSVVSLFVPLYAILLTLRLRRCRPSLEALSPVKRREVAILLGCTVAPSITLDKSRD
jgi:hypothetical protein